MTITQQQRNFVEDAIDSPAVQEFLNDVFWPMYDIWREEGELPEVNGPVHPLMFALIGYPFAVRDGLQEMRNDLDNVIEKLKNGLSATVWMP